MTLPRLAPAERLPATYRDFIETVQGAGFRGDVATDYAARLGCATDNSVYQILPQAVLHPRDKADVQLVMGLLEKPVFRGVTLTPRGGGTGTNGQSLTDGVVLDLSRHMHRILELDLEAGWVRVQPGVVLDQLNTYLAEHGVFFAPNLSPSNRATLGGMISTDAAGKGSRVYGKTSDHVVALETVFLGGQLWRSRPLADDDLAAVEARDDRAGEVHRTIHQIVSEKAAVIEEVFPAIRRFMTGYNLAKVYDAAKRRFDLNYFLAGSEGTLGVVVEAKLRITPVPAHTRLVLIKYRRFEDALASAETLAERQPSAIETVDETIMNLARQDVIFHRIRDFVEDVGEAPVAAVNLVEFQGMLPADVDARVDALVAELDAAVGQPEAPLGYYLARDREEMAALWALRKKGVGLLGNFPGPRQPVAFVEDTVVHPSRLRPYIERFRAILDGEGVRYGMFGHVDVGCLHVRPALDLKDPEDQARLRRISDQVCTLVHEFGGVIWGEHGKGMRSEYSPRFFGPLFDDLRRIKAVFDPHNQLNPGKLATAAGTQLALVRVDSPMRGSFDQQIDGPTQERFAVALKCNGNGACFDYSFDSVMCPSSKITRDRIHSPKGRAGVLREWLRLLAIRGFDASREAAGSALTAPFRALARRCRGWFSRRDYSHQVYDAMAGCLSCKACATQCPIKVDVPMFKADFLDLYHTRYPRPLRDHLVGALEGSAQMAARFPRLGNALGQNALTRVALRLLGIVEPPRFASPNLAVRLADAPASAVGEPVILVQDAFTSFFDVDAFLGVHALLTRLGFAVEVPPFEVNGKALHVKGMLRRFRAQARRTSAALEALAARGRLVGVEPAVNLVYEDEYPHVLGAAPPFRVMDPAELLGDHLERVPSAPYDGLPLLLFGHCTERTADPDATRRWQRVFSAAGVPLEIVEVGCCGMCGFYGHESEHVSESKGIFAQSWARRLEGVDPERVLATGYSCRSQVKRCAGFRPRHPAEALVAMLPAVASAARGQDAP